MIMVIERSYNLIKTERYYFFVLEVKIIINSDKSYFFYICEPSVALLLKLVSFKYEISVKSSGGFKGEFVNVVKLEDLFLISYFKFGIVNNITLKSVYGTLTSLDCYVKE